MDEQHEAPIGDTHGLPVAPDAASLRAGGADYLTRLFRAAGTLAPDNTVTRIASCEEWKGGATGRKLLLSLEYARDEGAPPADLFVKFSRNLDDPIRDRLRTHMDSEISFANLSRTPGFPIRVPACVYADYDRESGTGMLVTERIAYGQGEIEPHHPKCRDYEVDNPAAHYRALVRALARLAGEHKAGRLPVAVAERFVFDSGRALTQNRIPNLADHFRDRIARLAAFAADYPQFLPDRLRAADFLARLEPEAMLIAAHEDALRRFLYAKPDFIALCHWNGNIDNAWFWRQPDGELACGLLDWGSVGQMPISAALAGCLSGSETILWDDDRLGEMVGLFVTEFACGGPTLDPHEVLLHLKLHMLTITAAPMLGAPGWVLKEFPDADMLESRLDPRFAANEPARVQLQVMTNILHLWSNNDVPALIDRALAASMGG